MTLSRELIGVKQDVTDEMLLLNPYQIPLLDRLGFGKETGNTTHEWVEDEMLPMKSTIKGAITNTDTTITVNSIEPFRKDQVVRIGDELILINGISGEDLTVTRGFAETTAVAATDGSEIEVLFNNSNEGADARAAKYKPRGTLSNYTQIFDDTINISGTSQAVSQYGIADLYLHEKMKVEERLMLELEKALINGIKYRNGDRRMMSGIRQFIKTHIQDAAGSPISLEMINKAMRDIFTAGGMKEATKHIIKVPAIQKAAITNILSDKVRVTREDRTTGRTIDRIITDFGELDVVVNLNLRNDEIIITDLNRMEVKPLSGRGFFHQYLGLQGDYEHGQVIGEYTLEFKQEVAHARIKGLAVK